MNRRDLDTNILHNGEEILKFAKNNLFREGDELIAIQEDIMSKYVFKQYDNECYDFVDCEYSEETLDFFDLINCKFIIMLNKENENYIKVITTPMGFDTDLFINNHNEVMKNGLGVNIDNMDEIFFKNGSVIKTTESDCENIRGKRSELKHWFYDYEMNDVDLSFLDNFISKENIKLNDDEIIFMSISRKIK